MHDRKTLDLQYVQRNPAETGLYFFKESLWKSPFSLISALHLSYGNNFEINEQSNILVDHI